MRSFTATSKTILPDGSRVAKTLRIEQYGEGYYRVTTDTFGAGHVEFDAEGYGRGTWIHDGKAEEVIAKRDADGTITYTTGHGSRGTIRPNG